MSAKDRAVKSIKDRSANVVMMVAFIVLEGLQSTVEMYLVRRNFVRGRGVLYKKKMP